MGTKTQQVPSLTLFPKLEGCQERHVVTGVPVTDQGISCQLYMCGVSCVIRTADVTIYVLCIEFKGHLDDVFIFHKHRSSLEKQLGNL